MKQALIYTVFCLLAGLEPVRAHVYVVFFMTEKGVTGHVGLAVDNYKVIVRDRWIDGRRQQEEDTVQTGTLTFYDLWPMQDVRRWRFNRNTEAKYFQLPRTSAEPALTVESLIDNGLPHRYRHACDALLKVPTDARTDAALKDFIDQLRTNRNYYNARKYNCADFVRICLEKVLHRKIHSREFIPMSMVSTPNRMFRTLKKMPDRVEVLKDPGAKANGSFFVERILKNKS